ncbi:MAG: ATP-binding protein [Thermomicrobiales bacterium]
MTGNTRFETVINSQIDIERARRAARDIARQAGFNRQEAEAIALASTELASNLMRHASNGRIVVAEVAAASRNGVAVETWDCGPGIADVSLAIQDGFSTVGGLGSGLPAVRRLMDEFTIETSPAGSIIRACKWISASNASPSA